MPIAAFGWAYSFDYNLGLYVMAFAAAILALSAPRVGRLSEWTAYPLCLAAAGPLLAVATAYVVSPVYVDHVESGVAAVSWLAHGGGQVYPAPRAAARYAWPYGPMTFLLDAAAPALMGPSILASKLGGVLTLAGGLAAIAATAWRQGLRGPGLALAIAAYAAACSCFDQYTYWDRPDSFLLAAASGLTLTATVRPGLGAAVALGALAGLMFGLKPHAVAYALPPGLFLLSRTPRPMRFVIAAAIAALAVAIVPFTLPNVSATAYLAELRMTLRHGMGREAFVSALGMLLLCGAPTLIFCRRLPEVDAAGRWALRGFLLVAILELLPASKMGAGAEHLFPLLTLSIWLCVHEVTARRRLVPKPALRIDLALARLVSAPAVLAIAWIAFDHQTALLNKVRRDWRAAGEAAAEARAIAANPAFAPVQVVLSDGPGLSGKVQPVFLGQDFMLDSGVMMDFVAAGTPGAPATLQAISACRFRTYLFAAGLPPFADRSYYTGAPLYERGLIEAFRTRYHPSGRTRHFEVWRCAAAADPSPLPPRRPNP
jgi:hypothetical protein